MIKAESFAIKSLPLEPGAAEFAGISTTATTSFSLHPPRAGWKGATEHDSSQVCCCCGSSLRSRRTALSSSGGSMTEAVGQDDEGERGISFTETGKSAAPLSVSLLSFKGRRCRNREENDSGFTEFLSPLSWCRTEGLFK